MRIIDATVTQARRCREFDRIEARVRLTYEPFPGALPETRTILTSIAPEDSKGRSLRVRLIADAVRLAAMMPLPEIQVARAA